jgi:hypothetical protein
VTRPPTGRTTAGWRRRTAATAAVLGVSAAAIATACGPRRSVEAFCSQLKTVQDLDDVLAGDTSGPGVGEQAGQLQELRRVAPDELEPQVARLSSVTDDLARTMGTAPDPDSAASEVFTRRQAELPEITAAGKAVETFAAEHCQLALNATDTAPGPAGGPGGGGSTTVPAASTSRPPARATSRPPSTRSNGSATTRSGRSTGSTRATPTTRARATTTTRRR